MDKPKRNDRKEARERDAKAGLVSRVLHLRIKDKHAAELLLQARAVNLVWNYCNELSAKITEREHRFVSAYELDDFTAGAVKEGLDLHSQTLQAVSAEFVTRRKQFKKVKLRWRVSNPKSSKYSLGWVPFKKSAIAYRNGQVFFRGKPMSLWDSYGLSKYQLGAGSFSEDSRGRWYLNVTVKVQKKAKPATELTGTSIGIDLGLKDLMSASDGTKVEAEKFYRDLEPALAVAQRAGKKGRTRAIHAKIKNRRSDGLHKLSTAVSRKHMAIFVGNVNASGLAKTNMAKSVLDAGWSMFRTMLGYKCDSAGAFFKEIDERFSTQECHVCHARTGPKGLEELHVRRWTCSCCLTEHDRDTNSALVIEQRGLAWLELEFSTAADMAKASGASVNKVPQPAPA